MHLLSITILLLLDLALALALRSSSPGGAIFIPAEPPHTDNPVPGFLTPRRKSSRASIFVPRQLAKKQYTYCDATQTACDGLVCCLLGESCCGEGCCPPGYTCELIDGQIGCCPIGQGCSSASACLDPGFILCPGENFCCPPGNDCFRDASGLPTCMPPAPTVVAEETTTPVETRTTEPPAPIEITEPIETPETSPTIRTSPSITSPGVGILQTTTATGRGTTSSTGAPSQPSQPTSSGDSGLSRSDKIALGVGLGIGIPTFLVTLAMCLRGM